MSKEFILKERFNKYFYAKNKVAATRRSRNIVGLLNKNEIETSYSN